MNAEAEGITAEEAVRQARALYSKMKHYAELTDNENFASCFETAMDADTLQNQMKSVSQAEAETKNLTGHEDVCFLDPTKDKTQWTISFPVSIRKGMRLPLEAEEMRLTCILIWPFAFLKRVCSTGRSTAL